jgi:hypothetical protein
MNMDGTLLLSRRGVAELLTVDECLGAVEQAFKLYGDGAVPKPGILSAHCPDGAFHIKAGLLSLERPYFVVKTNGNFFQNSKRFGLPNIQGIILLCDAETGSPLALMDSIEITIRRTGAATAIAAKYLSRPESKTMTICHVACLLITLINLRHLTLRFSGERNLSTSTPPFNNRHSQPSPLQALVCRAVERKRLLRILARAFERSCLC